MILSLLRRNPDFVFFRRDTFFVSFATIICRTGSYNILVHRSDAEAMTLPGRRIRFAIIRSRCTGA